jgi:Protein of unknown function (DUF732)
MTFCVFCGATLTDPNRCEACGAYRLGATWCEGDGPAMKSAEGETGWRPDPTGRHEGRYFAAGQPTDLIRDGTVEAIDPLGKQQLNDAGTESYSSAPATITPHPHPHPHPRRRRWWWVLGSMVAVLVLAAAGTAAALHLTRDRESVDDKYLAAVREAGLSGEFNSNANAIAHGKQVCRKLEDGGPQQGMPVDEVGVEYYCSQFSEGFHVLETATIAGSFTLKDESPSYAASSIEVSGSSCTGAGGYSDVGPGTQVMVKNGKGDILTTSELESGQGGQFLCSFPFSFEVTEGEDRYIVSVGRRGDLSFSFGELKANGVALFLG